ncbi:granzyme B(G,H)-like [Seriola lalandi dorsalis]|uniref:trypsin n=1 Tax=Seriola lalandi dorsalis TaxID=1841481 RepID=A0A3B4XPN0_SERLL|nr:granzyme B(G,H)-like [Seriola lalandi dorsalis]XP_056235355.1 granzyme B(G,H)-like [Seriola aureovittata]
MFFQWKLVILILALSLQGQARAGKISGGHEAVPHSRPYMVIVEQHMEDGKPKYCDGFLLNEDFVMTAAHCQAKSYTVHLGVHNFQDNKEVQRISVEKAFPHKDYDAVNHKNDMMLLKLKSKANLNKNVKPIALANKDDGSLPKSCIVSGWGRSDSSKFMSVKLMEVNVTLIDNEMCVQNNLYCSDGAAGPEKGDSGGPLVCEDGKAFGVVSHKYHSAADGLPINCYTKIPENMSWINLAVKTA